MGESSLQYDKTRRTFSGEQLDALLGDLARLPTPPLVLARIAELAVLDEGESPPPAIDPQILAVARCDPALTAHLLRLAGARRGAALDVEAAVAAVDPADAREALLSGRPPADATQARLVEALWRHSLAVALAGEAIARRSKLLGSCQAVQACGLLHDIGQLALLTCVPKSFARAVDDADADRRPLAASERELLGVDHAAGGRRLAESWQLGEAIEQVVRMHHQPIDALGDEIPHAALIAAVQLANALVGEGGPAGGFGAAPAVDVEALSRRLELPEGAAGEIAASIEKRLDHQIRLLGLNRRRGEDLSVTESHARLALSHDALSRKVRSLTDQAERFGRLRRFLGSVSPRGGPADVLGPIAESLSDLTAAPATEAEPTVCYSLDRRNVALTALRWGGARQQRTLACAPLPETADAETARAGDALLALLAEPNALEDWFEPSGYSHFPLVCRGRWVGGVFLPSGSAVGQLPADPLADAAAYVLAAARERVRAEQLGEQFARMSEKLSESRQQHADDRAFSAMGELAGGAAHELNNPLAVVSGRAQLMRDRADNDADRRVWAMISEQAQRISDIVTELMEIASPRKPQPEPIDPYELLAQAVDRFLSSLSPLPQDARPAVDIEEGGPPAKVEVDREQMLDVVCELLQNATAAGGGRPRIRLSVETSQAGRSVTLAVRDEGTGMDAETLRQAFTPFFSSHQAGRRRGLGLTRARRYVELNGGRIWLTSAPERGAAAFVRLPVRDR